MDILFLLIVLFILFNIIQTIVILNYRLILKGIIVIIGIEALEIPLVVYLIMNGEVKGFIIIVMVEIIQWLVISFLSIKTDGYQKKEKTK